jgi:hypothetical protein
MEEILRQYRDIALSDKEVLKLVDGAANIIMYPDLIKYSNIDEILDPYGACFLLFEAKPKYGHWCCLLKRQNNIIEFFNPYGGYPDDGLKYIPMHFRKISNQYYPILSLLMYESPYKLEYNEHKFQKLKSDVKTCGRHCAVRLFFKNLSLEEYTSMIRELARKFNTDIDNIVTILTMWVNRK